MRDTAQNLAVLILLMGILLSACGGGGGSSAVEDNEASQDGDSIDSGGDGSEIEGGDTPTSGCQLTPSEENMLDQVNQARSQARDCGSTHYPATEPLSWNCKLQQAALSHSRDMAENNFFSHTGSDGGNPGLRINAQDYFARNWGENIAAGYPTIESATGAWLNSPGHCRNIMNSAYKEVGIALVENFNSDYNYYWTQVFAAPASANAIFYSNDLTEPENGLSGTDVYRYTDDH